MDDVKFGQRHGKDEVSDVLNAYEVADRVNHDTSI